MNKKIIIGIIGAVIGIIIIIIIFAVVAKGDKKAKEIENKNNTVEVENKTPDEKEEEKETKEEKEENPKEKKEEEIKEEKDNSRVTIKLNQKNQELKIEDELRIVFAGTKEEYGEDMYTYNADIYVKGNLVKNKVFNVSNTRVIYSSNHNAEFYVDKIDNVYIIVSHIIENTDGYFVIFVNDSGEILREFSNVKLTVKDHQVLIQVTVDDSEEGTINTNFLIDGSKLKIIYE